MRQVHLDVVVSEHVAADHASFADIARNKDTRMSKLKLTELQIINGCGHGVRLATDAADGDTVDRACIVQM